MGSSPVTWSPKFFRGLLIARLLGTLGKGSGWSAPDCSTQRRPAQDTEYSALEHARGEPESCIAPSFCKRHR